MTSCGTTSIELGLRCEVALQRDVEVLILGAGAVIGEVQRLLDQRIDVGLLPVARAAARMRQHALDDAVSAPAVFDDLGQVAGQQVHRVLQLGALVLVRLRQQRIDRLLQLVEQLARQAREVVDEVQRVLDLVGDAGGELAERGHLLGLDQVGLGGLQSLQRVAQLGEQAHVLDGDNRLCSEGFEQLDLLRRERTGLGSTQGYSADGRAFAQQWCSEDGTEAKLGREAAARCELRRIEGLDIGDLHVRPSRMAVPKPVWRSSGRRIAQSCPKGPSWAAFSASSPSRMMDVRVGRATKRTAALTTASSTGCNVGR